MSGGLNRQWNQTYHNVLDLSKSGDALINESVQYPIMQYAGVQVQAMENQDKSFPQMLESNLWYIFGLVTRVDIISGHQANLHFHSPGELMTDMPEVALLDQMLHVCISQITLPRLNATINQQKLNLHSQWVSGKQCGCVLTFCSNTATIETTYFTGMPCWIGAREMVSGPQLWHGAHVGSGAARNVSKWITVRRRTRLEKPAGNMGLHHRIQDIRAVTWKYTAKLYGSFIILYFVDYSDSSTFIYLCNLAPFWAH